MKIQIIDRLLKKEIVNSLLAILLIAMVVINQNYLKEKECLEQKISISDTFGQIKQINAGVLNVGYVDQGAINGPVILLLHGWPYDIHSFESVAPMLTARGYRVIIPYFRGFGSTTFLSKETIRNGQQSVLAYDMISLLDALKIKKVIVAGFDWGARTGDIMAALWPERIKGLVSVSGYLIINRSIYQKPLRPDAERGWWYQYYFATDRGRTGYMTNTTEFNKLIWKLASPKWQFNDATYSRTSQAFNNPDHVNVVIDNYRWRLGLSDGERQFDQFEKKLAASPIINVPTITIGSDFDGESANGSSYLKRFSGKYDHRVLKGIGHNVPQEAPGAFVKAILDVDKFK